MNWLQDMPADNDTTPFEPVNGSVNPPASAESPEGASGTVDLAQRREELAQRVAELQWDLGGLVYEMAIRDHIRVDVLVRRAAVLQEVDAELAEVDRIIKQEQTGAAGSCGVCGALHSRGAAFCWQCGQPLIAQVSTDEIAAS